MKKMISYKVLLGSALAGLMMMNVNAQEAEPYKLTAEQQDGIPYGIVMVAVTEDAHPVANLKKGDKLKAGTTLFRRTGKETLSMATLTKETTYNAAGVSAAKGLWKDVPAEDGTGDYVTAELVLASKNAVGSNTPGELKDKPKKEFNGYSFNLDGDGLILYRRKPTYFLTAAEYNQLVATALGISIPLPTPEEDEEALVSPIKPWDTAEPSPKDTKLTAAKLEKAKEYSFDQEKFMKATTVDEALKYVRKTNQPRVRSMLK